MDNQHRFEDALAAVTPRRTAALERMHLQKFQDEHIRQSDIAAQVSCWTNSPAQHCTFVAVIAVAFLVCWA